VLLVAIAARACSSAAPLHYLLLVVQGPAWLPAARRAVICHSHHSNKFRKQEIEKVFLIVDRATFISEAFLAQIQIQIQIRASVKTNTPTASPE
jgi:hypothetical protein